jgi:hypothetical protein
MSHNVGKIANAECQATRSLIGKTWCVVRSLTLAAVAAVLLPLAACGMGIGLTDLVTIDDVTPHLGIATHGTTTNTVQFKATGTFLPADCSFCTSSTQEVDGAHWTTSDALNTTVNNKGLATCLGTTVTPVTIVASAKNQFGSMVSHSAQLICH